MQPPVELRDILLEIPDAIPDVRYATEGNFTGKQLYTHQLAWLRPEALAALVLAAEDLRDEGYFLVIFDAFRPQSVQKKLRKACGDDHYVAEVSNHCRGITIDLTLADAHGTYLDMGSDYDDFSEKSHAGSKSITEDQWLRRQLLTDAMHRQGFVQHDYEWWHFDFRPDMAWELLDDESNSFVS